jgi:GNAT superfamily N-acetyltransferase
MNARLRIATVADSAVLIQLMSEFYAESDYAIDSERAEAAFSELLRDERLGRVWLIEWQSEIAGYVVLTLGYGMEYGGRDAFVDDLFVRPAFRGKGLGKMTLAEERGRRERRTAKAAVRPGCVSLRLRPRVQRAPYALAYGSQLLFLFAVGLEDVGEECAGRSISKGHGLSREPFATKVTFGIKANRIP